MADKKITITLQPNGTLMFTSGGAAADSFRIKPNNRLQWKCDDGPYGGFFADGSPFQSGKQAFAAEKGKGTKLSKIRRARQGGEPPFKYSVAVAKSDGTLATADPEIIIDDQGGGGGKK